MNRLLAASLTVLGSLSFALPISAETYKFNRHVGFMYVKTAEVYKNTDSGVTATANINMPTCDDNSYLAGYVNFSFTAEDGGYFSNYKWWVLGTEGESVKAFVNVPYDMSSSGILSISDKTYCESL